MLFHNNWQTTRANGGTVLANNKGSGEVESSSPMVYTSAGSEIYNNFTIVSDAAP